MDKYLVCPCLQLVAFGCQQLRWQGNCSRRQAEIDMCRLIWLVEFERPGASMFWQNKKLNLTFAFGFWLLLVARLD